MRRVYRFALMNLIGIVGATLTAVGVWSAYFSMNNDWLILAVFGALVTWFYIEVVTPNNKPKVINKVNIEDKDYTSIFNKK